MSFLKYISILVVILGCSNEASRTASRFGIIPDNAEIIYHRDNLIYVMDAEGQHETQITFDDTFTLEHVALSYDRTKIIANYFSDLSLVGQSSKLILYDLQGQTRTELLPDFAMAGNGGVDWDKDNYIYFSAVAKYPFPHAQSIPEFQANAGANDIYKMKFDGTDLQNLTNSTNRGEADVSVATDSQSIAYMATEISDPENTFTEIWLRATDGTQAELVFVGGPDRISSVHDPERSPDGNFVVFSQVNSEVTPVFPDNPLANTAHDIIKLDLSTGLSETITVSGPISIAPDWRSGKILYLEITDKTNPPHAGLAICNPDGTDYQLIKNGTNIGKWMPTLE